MKKIQIKESQINNIVKRIVKEMRTIETKIYTIDEHPNKAAVYDWVRNNWHDLNDHVVDEAVASLKALENEIGGNLDYSISQVPDRGEYVRIDDYDKDALMALNPNDLPLTGVWSDYEVIEGFQKGNPNAILDAVHRDTEYKYSDEGLEELLSANEYEFLENGKFYSE